MAFIPVPPEATLSGLAHELSRLCPLWTFQRDWKPGNPYPLKPDPRERTALVLENVIDVGLRPERPYEFHAAYRERGVPMTLLERLIAERVRLKENGTHWHPEFWIVCEGSLCFGAYAPMVRWFRGVLAVHFRPLDQPLASDERSATVHLR